MTALLTHVLAAYALGTVATWRVGWLEARHVPMAMVGSVLPDAAKVYLLTGSLRATIAGVEVSWLALQTVGVAVTLAVAGSLLVPSTERRAVLAVLVGGIFLHVVLDLQVVRAGGYAPPYLYPFSWLQLPSTDLYLSSDIWPAVFAGSVAVLVWATGRYRSTRQRTKRLNGNRL